MASDSTTPHVVEDCFGLVKLFSDGSIYRSPDIKPRNPYIHNDTSVTWKDCLYDAAHDLHLRLYKPRNPMISNKLPIIVYFHAGGFVFGSRTYPNPHNSCQSICSGVGALVVSVDFRLAPENRLPAALDDCRASLRWLQGQAVSLEDRDEWFLCDHHGVEFDRVFVFGDSSGGNIAHHLAVELGTGSPELSPVRIRGYMLLSPFFGGTVKTKVEVERPCEEFWSQEIYERFWRLAVPKGANLDHPLVNPFGPASPSLETANLDPILVLVGADEVLKDRAEDYATRLKQLDKKIKYVAFQGKQHGFFTSNSYTEEANDVIRAIKEFVSENSVLT